MSDIYVTHAQLAERPKLSPADVEALRWLHEYVDTLQRFHSQADPQAVAGLAVLDRLIASANSSAEGG